jgi:hypothetical protein
VALAVALVPIPGFNAVALAVSAATSLASTGIDCFITGDTTGCAIGGATLFLGGAGKLTGIVAKRVTGTRMAGRGVVRYIGALETMSGVLGSVNSAGGAYGRWSQ